VPRPRRPARRQRRPATPVREPSGNRPWESKAMQTYAAEDVGPAAAGQGLSSYSGRLAGGSLQLQLASTSLARAHVCSWPASIRGSLIDGTGS
jgi:hypothetical protein